MAIAEGALEANQGARAERRLDSYRKLAEVFHHVLAEQSLDTLLERLADTLAELIPYDTLTVYSVSRDTRGLLLPVLARDQWAEEIMNDRVLFGEGITGWAVENQTPILANQAHLDPRVQVVPGTPLDPEALICVPLVSRGEIQGALNIYRIGEEASFSDEDLELAKRFGDAAALAMDNAERREQLERMAHTDSLTGLYNHRFFYERLRAELTRASRSHDCVALLMLDIDDFKRLNDIFGHGVGDQVLTGLASMLTHAVRASDVACRIGGEEFAVIMPSCDAGDALGLASRLQEALSSAYFDPAGRITMSMGASQGPEHAMNPRELVACGEMAMMTAKARGKNRVVLFEEHTSERPDTAASSRQDVRSIAHLKMLQSLAGKLNRLNNVREIGTTIANELRTLIDYHNCRVYVADGDYLEPIAFRGELSAYEDEDPELLACKFGEGITGRVAASGRAMLIANAMDVDFAVTVPGTDDIDESMIVVPLSYGARVIGVVAISKLGVAQFDEDDLRLMEVAAGNASVALENARLYEAQRREAENAKALLEYADEVSTARSNDSIARITAQVAIRLLSATQSSLWLLDERAGDYRCASHVGYLGDPTAEAILDRVIPQELAVELLAGRSAPFIVAPEETRALFPPTGESMITRNVALAPLHGVRGWIVVRQPTTSGPYFSKERLLALAGLSYQASLAMEKNRLFRAQEENAEIANALLQFSREVARAEGMEMVLERIVESASRLLGTPTTSVWLQDPSSKEMRMAALWGAGGEPAERLWKARIAQDVALPFLALEEPFTLTRADLDGIEGAAPLALGENFAVAPLQLEGGLTGFIATTAPEDGSFEFSERKMRLLSGIAQQARLGINNASSFESLELTFLSTVESLANALEAKDEYTSSHTRWITDMSLEVGALLELDAKSLKNLELGALFHDIGKIGIPHSILLKEGPLTEAEWKTIKTHPELGEKILAPIDRLAEVRPIVRGCHERYDGNGYPDGKKGAGIPIEARIILVCDAFHAMTTDRPYRARLPVKEACRRLLEASGTQFDPRVVEAFSKLAIDRPNGGSEVKPV